MCLCSCPISRRLTFAIVSLDCESVDVIKIESITTASSSEVTKQTDILVKI